MEELDHVFRRRAHQGLVDAFAHHHCAHRDRAVSEPFGETDHVRDDAEEVRRERRAEPPEAGDDLVEDEQDAVLIAETPQALEIAPGRDQHAGRACHRLHYHRRDTGRVVQRDDAILQLVGEMRTPGGLPAGERVLFEVVGVGEVIDGREQVAERLAVRGYATHRDAAEASAMVAALASDQPAAVPFPARTVIGQRDLERRVH